MVSCFNRVGLRGLRCFRANPAEQKAIAEPAHVYPVSAARAVFRSRKWNPPPPPPSTRFCFSPPLLFTGAVCALGTVIVGIHAHVQKNVMSDPECVPPEIGRPKSKTATSMGLVVGGVLRTEV